MRRLATKVKTVTAVAVFVYLAGKLLLATRVSDLRHVGTVLNPSLYMLRPSRYPLSRDHPVSTRNQSIASSKLSDSGTNTTSSNLFRIEFDETHGNYSEFWRTVRALVGKDCLYPGTYDATQVTGILRRGRIIYADLFKKQTSLKLKLVFEGQQSAIFKIMLVDRMNKSKACNVGCEHPEYEVTAFTLNRMFDLRNMPYTTGRVISWSELESVASPQLKEFALVQADNSVCFNWTCNNSKPLQKYCFMNGKIPGAVIYFIQDKEIDFMRSQDNNVYHGYYKGVAEKSDINRLPGDKRFCMKFRQDSRYKEDAWFLDLVDIAILDYLMSHRDAKHTYLADPESEMEPEFNVMIDFGQAFCKTDDVAVLAPLTQCCRIRRRLYQAMELYRDTLEETFTSLTQDDPLHPLLLPELMQDLKRKFKQTLSLIDFCRNLDGDSEVFIEV